MRVLVACEFSGVTRDAFLARGHDAVSCDLEPTWREGPHIEGDVLQVLTDMPREFDLMIAYPPCTYIANAGIRWIDSPGKQAAQKAAVMFVWHLMNAPVAKICIENPVGILSTRIRPPDQIIQPWEYGHPESKRTCLWLKNLPPLTPTNILPKRRREKTVHMAPERARRQLERSLTYPGIVRAMAAQWGYDDEKKEGTT